MPSQTATDDVIDPDDLRAIDEELLDILQDGRGSGEPWGYITPGRAQERLREDYDHGVEVQYVQQRLDYLRSHGHVEKAGRGVYRFVDDPREA